MSHRSEKRRAPRTRTESVLELYDDSGNLIVGVGHLMNYSAMGACFTTTKRLQVGERLVARMRLVSEIVAEISATVIWMKSKSGAMVYGIEFENRQDE
ncbi:MAG: PilZ domain-containing protein [Elusimicrobiota bacterium]|jgi:hypothetical protein